MVVGCYCEFICREDFKWCYMWAALICEFVEGMKMVGQS